MVLHRVRPLERPVRGPTLREWPLARVRERVAALLDSPRSAGRRVESCPNGRAISEAPPACASGAPVEGQTPSGGFEGAPATPRLISTTSRESPRIATPLARGGVDRLDSERVRAVRTRSPGKLTAHSRFPVRAPASRSRTRGQAVREARSGLRRARVFARFESVPEPSLRVEAVHLGCLDEGIGDGSGLSAGRRS